jgi:hypothetical protein
LQLGVMLYIISDPHNMAFFIVGLIDTGANVVACSWDKAEHWCSDRGKSSRTHIDC